MKNNKIIYEEIQYSLKIDDVVYNECQKKPIKLIWSDGHIEYSIPVPKIISPVQYVIHREDGPAIIEVN